MTASIAHEREAVVREARAWLGTPFHHASRLKGVGVDCAQFLIAVYVGLGIVESFEPGVYAVDWFLHQDGERFLGWVERSCVATDSPERGDVMLYRYGRAVSHGAIYAGDRHGPLVIHAFRGRGVIEEECGPGSPLGARFAGAWSPTRWRGLR